MSKFFSITLYNITGQTPIRQLASAYNKQFNDDIKGEGSFNFTMPTEDTNDIAIGKIVKYSYGENSDDYIFAGVIENIKRNITNDENITEISGRGIKSLLESALIYTEDRVYNNENVGFIFKELFDEAQTRGALSGFSLTFDDTVDSNNEAWTVDEEIFMEEKIGTNLYSIINRHEEFAIYSRILPDMTINYYKEIGTDRTIGDNPLVLRVGLNIINYEKTIQGPVKNAILGTYGEENLIIQDTDTTSITNNGRFETYLSLSNIKDNTSAEKIIQKTLDRTKTTDIGATIEITEEGYLPYIDFFIGDKIYITDNIGNREAYIVRAITISDSEEGAVRIIPELGTVKAALEERLRRLIARNENKTASGNSDGIASGTDIDGVGAADGGGAELVEAEVLTYDYQTQEGTADSAAIELVNPAANPIDFTNATGSYLAEGDIVTIGIQTSNDPNIPDKYIATGILSRANPETENLIYRGTVDTYDPLTKTGIVDIPALETTYPTQNPANFRNGTGQYLVENDEILVSTYATNSIINLNEFVAIGIISRAGQQTPVNQPIGTLSAGFPLRTDNLPNGFQGNINVEGGRGDLYDLQGNLGAGLDAIIGPEYIALPNTFNGFSRDTQSSFTINAPVINTFSSAVFTKASYLLNNGRIILIDGTSQVEVRDPNTGIWTTAFDSPSDIQDVAFDYSNEWLWLYVAGTSPVAGGPFFSMGPNDTAPVGRGDLGLGLSTTTADTTVRIAAGDGQLVLQYNDPEPGNIRRYYYKNSANTGNFTYTYTTADYILNDTATNGNHPLQVVKAEGFYYLTQYTASSPDEVAINYFDNSNGITTTYLTGIEWGTDPRKPYGYTITDNGIHLITCVRDVSGTDRISLASNNLSTTSYIYTDTTRAVNSADFIGAPREIEPNKIRFSAHEAVGSGGAINGAYTYEVILT